MRMAGYGIKINIIKLYNVKHLLSLKSKQALLYTLSKYLWINEVTTVAIFLLNSCNTTTYSFHLPILTEEGKENKNIFILGKHHLSNYSEVRWNESAKLKNGSHSCCPEIDLFSRTYLFNLS